MPEKRVGKVEHYYPKAKAVAVGLTDDLKVGDEVHIVGHGDDVRKKVTSLQENHMPIQEAHAGQHVGIGLATKVHEGDDVLVAQSIAKRAAKRKSATKAKAAKPKPKKATGKPKKAARKSARKPKKASRKRPAKRSAKKARKAASRPKARKAPKRVSRKAPKRKR